MPISTAAERGEQYAQCVNPQWVQLLDLLQMNARYERRLGAVLTTVEGKRVLDFLSGYCVHNTGHNHPRMVAALKDELDRQGPAMLQSHVPELAGELAERLVARAGGRLSRAFFCSSGSESVAATQAVSDAVYSSLGRSLVHTSTFGENALAMRAGLATLDAIEDERLGERAARLGTMLRRRLRESLAPYEIVKEVRGEGLLCGIEFTAPRQLRQRAAFEAFRRIHPAMFGQTIVMRLFRDHGILTQVCGNHFMTLKAAPPLVVEEIQIDAFVRAVREVAEEACHSMSFWSEALGMAKRLVHV